MKTLLLMLFLLFSAQTYADVYVHGYTRKDGTYVNPHYRSDPNNTTLDNWSTQGNVNPYTGQRGTKDPYESHPYTDREMPSSQGYRMPHQDMSYDHVPYGLSQDPYH